MSTLKQITANRANAQKSTGPRTAAGKAISARNRTRDGILAATIVIPGESVGRFYEVLDSLVAEFQPATFVENALVENMTAARWRQMRMWRFEKAVLDGQPSPASSHQAIETIHRCERAYVRMFNSSRNALKTSRTRSAQQLPSKLRK